MPDIYLRHPIHGEKVEHNEALAAMDKGNGWVQFDPNERAAPAAVVTGEDTVAPQYIPEAVPPEPVLPAFLAPPPPKVRRPKP